MRQIRTTLSNDRAVIDVDGCLDAVGGRDLTGAVEAVWTSASPRLHLDLTQVNHADADGLAALARCSAHAVALRHVLTWSRCSRPLLYALQSHPDVTGTGRR